MAGGMGRDGNSDQDVRGARCTEYQLVIAGLDPVIHGAAPLHGPPGIGGHLRMTANTR
jgi:hypothetical protein